MAVPFVFPTTLPADSEQVGPYLRKHFNVPDDTWWNGVHRVFSDLQIALEQGPQTLTSELDEVSLSAQAARNSVSPIVKLYQCGTFKLNMTAQNELLTCYAVGTISPKIYAEMFWDVVLRLQDEDIDMVVYEALEGSKPCFLFRYQGYNFFVTYLYCDKLIREYPDIVDAPDSFLVHYCTDDVRVAVEDLKRGNKDAISIDSVPALRKAYHYIRAWAVARGLFRHGPEKQGRLTWREILKWILASDNPSFSGIVLSFFDTFNNYCIEKQIKMSNPPYPEALSIDWVDVLEKLRHLPVQQKLEFSHKFVQVNILYSGTSDIAAGAWISMVEKRLEKLKERIEAANIPNLLGISPWPYRLTNEGNIRGLSAEGCFLLGINVENGSDEWPTSHITDLVERWKSQVESDRVTVTGQCFINVIYPTCSNIEALVPWTRVFTRPVISVDKIVRNKDEYSVGATPKRSKSPKNDLQQNHYSSPGQKLRPALDVLKRLRYDQNLNIDEFKVGYEDRHSVKIMEKAAADWQMDITHEEFIPQHRIVYFKRYPTGNGLPEMLWEKTSKMDKIFKESSE